MYVCISPCSVPTSIINWLFSILAMTGEVEKIELVLMDVIDSIPMLEIFDNCIVVRSTNTAIV